VAPITQVFSLNINAKLGRSLMKRSRVLLHLLLLLLSGWIVFRFLPIKSASTIVGEVHDANGPVAGAVVRYKGQAESVHTAADGRFVLPKIAGVGTRITASKEGYFIAGAPADSSPLVLNLQRLPGEDSEAYHWVDPAPDPASPNNCGNCHAEIHREWSLSGHARSVSNRRFINLYDGTDWQGRPNRGWNLLAEHPDGAGVCTACHGPAVKFDDPAYYDLREARGVAVRGVHCDYCHKVAGMTGGRLGWTHGRFGLKLLRPDPAEAKQEHSAEPRRQIFFGPLDDVDRGEDAFAGFYKSSRYCASCHEGVVFGVHVYSTYSEWRESPAFKVGKECQSCHMAPTGELSNIAPGRGGISRDPQTLASHGMFTGSQKKMLQDSLKVAAHIQADEKEVNVAIELRADNIGHRLPTGFVDRSLVLVVEARRGDQPVALRSGPVLPVLAGKDLAGLSGRLFAKQLKNFEGISPAPFWKARTDHLDTRLFPGRPERSQFIFAAAADRILVRVLYRRFWAEVTAVKGWPDDTISVISQEWAVPKR
jgi:hypothetical protein